MRVKKIELKNGYKRFHHLSIDLGDKPARIVALVGPNGCGKSSVLDGMLYLQGSLVGLGKVGARDYLYHSQNGDPAHDYNSVVLDFEDGKYEQLNTIRHAAGTSSTMFSFRSSYRYNSNVKIDRVTSVAAIALNGDGASMSVDLDQKMEGNYRRLQAKYNRYRDTNDVKPSEAIAKILGDLNAAIGSCLDLEISSLGNVEDNKGTLYFKKRDHSKEFEFNVLSAGEKEAVDILLDLYLRQDDYNDTIFLVDEPELHINTAVQRKLLLAMNGLIGAHCQLWIATHSVGFLRALQSDLKNQCQIIYFQEGTQFAAGRVDLKPVIPSQSTWREIFATALDDLSGLVSPKRIIYCEGRGEPGKAGRERGLDAQVLNAIFAQSYPDTLFVSSGGNTELDQRMAIAIGILSKALPALEILLLKDRDLASGAKATEADRQLYLKNNPDSHRALKRWEIENYVFDHEVLDAYSAANGLSFNHAGYVALVSNIDDDDVKGEVSRIKSLCGITTSINAEQFKLNLAQMIQPHMAAYKCLEDCIFNRK